MSGIIDDYCEWLYRKYLIDCGGSQTIFIPDKKQHVLLFNFSTIILLLRLSVQEACTGLFNMTFQNGLVFSSSYNARKIETDITLQNIGIL